MNYNVHGKFHSIKIKNKMANKNTKHARSKGFCSMDDMNSNGNKIFKGSTCDTAWDNPNSKRTSRKQYKPKAS